jgi:hypothetical protein
MNVSSIVHVKLSTEANIHRNNHVCIVLSFRSTAKALDPFVEKRSHVAVWNWAQFFHPNKFYLKRSRVAAFIIDETIQNGSDYAWLWVVIEPLS